MFYDFNLVCCAIATVSAAVGYRYTRGRSERRTGISRAFELRLPDCVLLRRRGSNASQASISVVSECETSDSLSSLDCPTPHPISEVTEPGSLKRKTRDEDDDNFSDDCRKHLNSPTRSEPPRKRCCTPSGKNEQPEDTTPANCGGDLPEYKEKPTSPSPCDQGASTPRENNTAAMIEHPGPASTSPQNNQKISSFSIPACKPSSAFAAFAGTSSGFSTTSQIGGQRPAWCALDNSESESQFPSSSVDLNKETSVTAIDSIATEEKWLPSASVSLLNGSTEVNALAAHEYSQSTHVGVTGEEEEDLKAELKGVKLFIKRGDGEFSTGMFGHIKLLSHKMDKSERLVFRREPVWKVSMCVGLRPAVRCSFDEEQGNLRVALKETVSTESESAGVGAGQPQVVLYALKRGRVPRDDFAAFAQEVMQSMRVKS